jgi:hypothetical protein
MEVVVGLAAAWKISARLTTGGASGASLLAQEARGHGSYITAIILIQHRYNRTENFAHWEIAVTRDWG